jgi:NAD+ synthetase
MNGGLNLIGDLYKTEVYALARHINEIDPRHPIPVEIIDKAPSAELFEDQKDSDSLPPYEELDAILRLYIERDLLSSEEIESSFAVLDKFHTPDLLLSKIMGMVDRAEFKRWQSCPILRLHARSFGTGRRYPIAQGFRPTADLLRTIRPAAISAK